MWCISYRSNILVASLDLLVDNGTFEWHSTPLAWSNLRIVHKILIFVINKINLTKIPFLQNAVTTCKFAQIWGLSTKDGIETVEIDLLYTGISSSIIPRGFAY